MASEINFLQMDPVYRQLQKLKVKAREENVSPEINAEIERIIDLVKIRSDYCDKNTASPSKDLQLIMAATLQHPWQTAYDEGKLSYLPTPLMMIGNLEAQLLRSLASLGNVKRVLELGLFTGCSALAMAESLPEDGKVISCEIDPYIANLARSLLDKTTCGNKVDIMRGSAKDSLKILAEKKMEFDLIFIDVDKSGYSLYYKMIFDLGLLAPRGTILVDNALFFGDPYTKEGFIGDGGEGVARFNDVVRQDESVHKILVPIRDGLMIVRRKDDVDKSN